MEPAQPFAPPAGPPPPPPLIAPPPFVPRNYLAVRARADLRMVIGAVTCGALLDVAAHSGAATVAVTCWLAATAAAILLTRRVKGLTGNVLFCAGAALGVLFTIRTSAWVLIPAGCAIALVLGVGASLGAYGASLSMPFPCLSGPVVQRRGAPGDRARDVPAGRT